MATGSSRWPLPFDRCSNPYRQGLRTAIVIEMQSAKVRRLTVATLAAVSMVTLILTCLGTPLATSEAVASTPLASSPAPIGARTLDPQATATPVSIEVPTASPSLDSYRTTTPTPSATPNEHLVRRRTTTTNPVVDLQLAPVTWPVLGRNQTLATDIVIRAGTQAVTVVAVYLDFDPTRLQVTSLEFVGSPENPINIAIQATYSNATGRIDISTGVFVTTSTPGTGYFRIARVVFRPTDVAVSPGAMSVTTQISFANDAIANRETAVIHGDYSLVRTAPSLTVAIDPGAAPLIDPTAVPVTTLQRGIAQSFAVTARDRSNSPLVDVGYVVTGNPATAFAFTPGVGASAPGGLAPVTVSGLTTSGTGVVDLTFRSPSLPGGEVRMSRLVKFTNPSNVATPTPLAQSTTAQMSLQTGWNLVALPLLPNIPMTSLSLCAIIDGSGGTGTAVEVSQWIYGGWETARCNLPGSFPMDVSRGYFVRLSKPATIQFSGTRISGPVSLSIATGWNLVSFPVCRASDTASTAVVLVDTAAGAPGTTSEIDRWESGAWDGHIANVALNRFPIELGRGYFVRSSRTVAWTMQ